MLDKKFLYDYLNNASPTGFESAGQRIWLDYLRDTFDAYEVDTYGSVCGIINPGKEYRVVIEAHADEISWFVNYITDDGYLYVIRNGGSDPVIAPSMRVNLHTDKGIIKGVFGWPAIHVRVGEKDDPRPELKNIFIDVGASSRTEVEEMGINVGTVATFADELMELNGKYLTGRALDNRIGGYMIAQVARRLRENGIQLPYSLYVVNSVQEEIGLRGAEMMAARINPHTAIITDVCHDTFSPLGYSKPRDGATQAGKGAVLSFAPAVQNNLLKRLIEVAQANQIPFQRHASSRSTGTDTDSFAYSGAGIASALISLPLKYMHTTVETAHVDDIEAVIQLMYSFLVQLEAGADWRYFM